MARLAYDLIKRVPLLRGLKHRISYFLWKLKLWLRLLRDYSGDYDLHRLYWIDPVRITRYYTKASKFEKPLDEIGMILTGDWDLDTEDLQEIDVYRAFWDHFEKNKPWETTDFYARVVNEIKSGRTRWCCTSESEFQERLKTMDDLFLDIQKNGYKTQEELQGSAGVDFQLYGTEDEVRVHINRDGDYLFADGRHRLSIAKVLHLESVAVKVSRRHKKWVDFRKEILAYAQEMYSGKIYQPILHPDLADIPSAHGSQRWDMISPHVKGMTGRVLDIGANWGFFSHCFESAGFNCVAVEVMPRDAYFLHKLQRAENKKFEIVETSILDYNGSLDFEIVLALNILHHFLKTEPLFHQLCVFLERLNCDVMFFQPHLVHEPQMQNAYRNFTEEQYVRFIQEKAGLSKATLLGKDDDGRSFYKLES